MRIVAGEFRGRKIAVPDTKETRPTMDKTRQAVFNILRSAAWAMKSDGTPILYDAHVMDVFAGSGAMGLEALSQGAQKTTFVESGRLAAESIRENIKALKLEPRAALVNKDALKLPPSAVVFDLVFLDPPYGEILLPQVLETLREKNYISAETLLVLEMPKRQDPPEDLNLLDTRQYGVSKIVFAKAF
jgi:16S rRNA (guanine966-N2)-methyltransferase